MASTSIVLVVSTLIHGLVRNPDRQDLGRIEDLAIDVDRGRVVYAVLSFHGLLGFENKLFAIPWDAFNFDPDDKTMVLEVSAETLENAPSFDKDDWPDMNEGAWGEAIYQHYGYVPYWQVSPPQKRVVIEDSLRRE